MKEDKEKISEDSDPMPNRPAGGGGGS